MDLKKEIKLSDLVPKRGTPKTRTPKAKTKAKKSRDKGPAEVVGGRFAGNFNGVRRLLSRSM